MDDHSFRADTLSDTYLYGQAHGAGARSTSSRRFQTGSSGTWMRLNRPAPTTLHPGFSSELLRAPVGHTEVSPCRSAGRGGLIDRSIRWHSRPSADDLNDPAFLAYLGGLSEVPVRPDPEDFGKAPPRTTDDTAEQYRLAPARKTVRRYRRWMS